MDFLLWLDSTVLNFLNGLVGELVLLDTVFVFLAQAIIFFIGIGVFFLCSRRVIAMAYLGALFGRGLFTPFLRYFFFRERPFLHDGVTLLVDKNPLEASFPSGHTVFMFAISFAVFRHNKKFGLVFLIVSFLSALARVVVGAHYPSDILGGIVLGFISILLAKWLIRAIIATHDRQRSSRAVSGK